LPPLAIAIFARAPVAGYAKTRLIPLLGPRSAADFQAALILDTTRKVNKVAEGVARWLYLTGGPTPDFPGRNRWAVEQQRGHGLGQRLDRAFRQMLSRHSAAIIVGTDSPLLSPRAFRQAWSELRVCDAVIGPCPDGGFYLIGLRRIVRGLFLGVRWSTRHAFRDVLRQLLGHGFACAILANVPDVDRPQDLRELARQMARQPSMRARAPATWRFLKDAEKNWK
jgi:rSAM/selenodomain-associated transferase 1